MNGLPLPISQASRPGPFFLAAPVLPSSAFLLVLGLGIPLQLSELRETAFRGVVVHVERRLRVGAEPRAERIEAALRVMLGDERVDDSLRRAEASRQSWVTRRRRAA